LETLRVIEAILPPDIQLLIPFAKTKIDRNGVIIDEQTLEHLKFALNKLDGLLIEQNALKQLPLNIPEN
jgi:hypothetical protein